MVEMNLQEALKIGLENEVNGNKFYSKIAEEAKNEFTKNTFKSLAEDEIRHIKAIEDFMNSIKESSNFDAATALEKPNVESTMQFFGQSIEDFKQRADEVGEIDIGPYHMALDMEQRAFELYKKQMEKATDEKIKIFFQ